MDNKKLISAAVASLLMAGGATAATDISMWYHGAGNEVERGILNDLINDFNSSQSDWNVVIEEFPQESYNDSVTAAALAGNLPDIIDVDGPIMPNWAWAGYLQPLGIDRSKVDKFLPGAVGAWDGTIYAVGLWDAACALFTRRSTLEDNGIRIPDLSNPWTVDEFNDVLAKLQATGKYDYVFDVGMAWTGEWYPYAFGPMLQSTGGDLFNNRTKKADGTINGDAALRFGQWWQMLFEKGYTPGTSQDGADRETGFLDGKYAIQLNGNWAVLPAVEKFGDDFIVLPAVDFGNGPKIGAASWQFGISATSKNPDGARAFIEYAMQDKYLAAFSDGLGLIPPTKASTALSQNYRPGGVLEPFFELSRQQATLRAVTPGYPVAAKEFEKAMADIANGADVADALDAAADVIDADVANNNGYR